MKETILTDLQVEREIERLLESPHKEKGDESEIPKKSICHTA